MTRNRFSTSLGSINSKNYCGKRFIISVHKFITICLIICNSLINDELNINNSNNNVLI